MLSSKDVVWRNFYLYAQRYDITSKASLVLLSAVLPSMSFSFFYFISGPCSIRLIIIPSNRCFILSVSALPSSYSSESVIVSFESHIGTSSKSSLPWSKRVRKAKAILATSICASLTPLPLPTILLQSPPPSIPLRTTSTMVGPRTL